MNWRQHMMHCTEIAEDTSGGPLSAEWNFYRREVCRLLIQGNDNRWAVIKGEQIVGVWDAREAAVAAAAERFPGRPVLVKQILEWEPLVRLPYRWSYGTTVVPDRAA